LWIARFKGKYYFDVAYKLALGNNENADNMLKQVNFDNIYIIYFIKL